MQLYAVIKAHSKAHTEWLHLLACRSKIIFNKEKGLQALESKNLLHI
jgi:hypothetical protein